MVQASRHDGGRTRIPIPAGRIEVDKPRNLAKSVTVEQAPLDARSWTLRIDVNLTLLEADSTVRIVADSPNAKGNAVHHT
jgi:hypothetical protein